MKPRKGVLALSALAVSGASFIASASPAAADSSATGSGTIKDPYGVDACELSMSAQHITNNGQQRLTVALTVRGLNGYSDAACQTDNLYANVTYKDSQGDQRLSGAQTSTGKTLFASYDGVPGGARVDSFYHAAACGPSDCTIEFSTNTSPK